MRKRCPTARSAMSGRQVLIAQAAVVGGLLLALLIRQLPSVRRELRIYRMTGGPCADRRHR
ncbi:hypothetical protein [Streptomyces sp. NPDC046942]|uniref:hypothetical protein n=1 Tax=Streptomyces sp. NPDC046942 TaxID=3155137 RepID=UPI0033E7EADF